MARGGADRVEGATAAGELRIRVSAPPADGRANRALVELLARELRVAKSSVTVEAGTAARRKRLRVDGLSASSVAQRWPGIDVIDVG